MFQAAEDRMLVNRQMSSVNAVLSNVASSTDGPPATTITVTGTTSRAVVIFGVRFAVNVVPGAYPFSFTAPGAAASQSVGIVMADWGIVAGDTVYIQAYTNSDPLDGVGTRIYGTPTLTVVLPAGANTFAISGTWGVDSADNLVSVAKSPSAGQLIWVWGMIANSILDTIAVSDNGTGSWNTFTGTPVSFAAFTDRIYGFWKIAAGNETTITVTRTSGTGRIGMHCALFTTSSAAAEDGFNSASSLGGTSPNPGTITKAAAGLVLGFVTDDTGHPTPTLTAGGSNTIGAFADSQYNSSAASGSNSAAWTLVSGWHACIAGMK